MLDKLLTIKRHRETDAIARLGEARLEYENLQAACRAKERELRDYGAWRKNEDARLYQAVHRQNLSRTGLEHYCRKIALLRSRELQFENDLASANQAAKVAEKALLEAKQKRSDARREVVRFEEYHSRVTETEKRKAEHLEETEVEESVATRF